MSYHNRNPNTNNTIASNLILAALGLGIINFLLDIPAIGLRKIAIFIFVLALNISIAILVRKGIVWFKWFMLAWTILGILSMGIAFQRVMSHGFIIGGISILQTVLQTIAVVFMFLKPNRVTEQHTEI